MWSNWNIFKLKKNLGEIFSKMRNLWHNISFSENYVAFRRFVTTKESNEGGEATFKNLGIFNLFTKALTLNKRDCDFKLHFNKSSWTYGSYFFNHNGDIPYRATFKTALNFSFIQSCTPKENLNSNMGAIVRCGLK